MPRTNWVFAAFVALAGLAGPAFAQGGAGQALGVDPQAEAKGDADRVLVVGADIFIGDRILTGASGQVEILFSDNTELVVGPRSSLMIRDYLLREDGSAGKMVLDILGGTFRFVTGGAASDRYLLDTPTGTIGVRGTAFELRSTEEGDFVLVRDGSVIGCNDKTGECQVTTAVCEVLSIADVEVELLGNAQESTGETRSLYKEYWIYATDQSGLQRRFRLNGFPECLKNTPDFGGGAGGAGAFQDPDDDDPYDDFEDY